jgi:hypothetical protein
VPVGAGTVEHFGELLMGDVAECLGDGPFGVRDDVGCGLGVRSWGGARWAGRGCRRR